MRVLLEALNAIGVEAAGSALDAMQLMPSPKADQPDISRLRQSCQ